MAVAAMMIIYLHRLAMHSAKHKNLPMHTVPFPVNPNEHGPQSKLPIVSVQLECSLHGLSSHSLMSIVHTCG